MPFPATIGSHSLGLTDLTRHSEWTEMYRSRETRAAAGFVSFGFDESSGGLGLGRRTFPSCFCLTWVKSAG